MGEIIFKGVSKKYKGNSGYALENFSLKVKDGEFIAIVGPSGSGKSTLLELICGFESLTEGDILLEGKTICNQLPKDRNVAMVFQNYALLPHLTVYENIAFGMKIRKIPKGQRDEKVRWAAKLLELEDYLSVKPKKLSGGQRQRVALARAMVREPKLFLMDEPLSNLDAKLKYTMCHEIKALHHKLKTTMLYITHDQGEAMMLADRVVILNEGRIQQVGSPMEVYHRPQNIFVASFIGRPQINLFNCEVREDGILLQEELLLPKESMTKALEEVLEEGKFYKIGLRAEHISIVNDGAESIEVHIKQIEYLGSESIVYLQYKTMLFTAKISGEQVIALGDKMRIFLNLEKAHYFHGETGERIS